MRKIGLIVKREYLYNLRKPSFLFAAFGTPLLIIVVFVIAVVLSSEEESLDEFGPVGYVDNSGVLPSDVTPEDYPNLFTPYEAEDAARAALDEGTLDAYLVIPENYINTGGTTLYSSNDVPEELDQAVEALMVTGLSAQLGADIPAARVIEPADLTVRLLDSNRELEEEAFIPLLILPFFFAVVFTLASQVTSGFLMSGLVEEKTNRIMEILVTSVTPMQLLAGKIIGLGLLGLTQVTVWFIAAVAILTFGESLAFLEGVTLPLDLVIAAVVYFLLGYFMTASIMAGIGAVVGSEQESRQYSGMITLVFFVPYFFIVSFVTNPNGTVPVILSLVPFTSPMSMIIRIGLVAVPLWQLVTSVVILLLTTIFIAWLSAKIFRLGLLLYGKRFTPRQVLRVLSRSTEDIGTMVTGAESIGRETSV